MYDTTGYLKTSYFIIKNNHCSSRCKSSDEKVKDKNNFLCVYNGLEKFRQDLGGELTIVMPDHLGQGCQINSTSYEEIKRALLEKKNSISTK